MNEIKKCSIAGVSFTLESDAYDALSAYIDSLNATYKDDSDGEEIIADIEARIAELILSAQPADAIIAKPLIENIIRQLGSASEIDEEHGEHHAETGDRNGNPRIPRRLYRDLQNGKLGGVCAGLANYFDTDPTWIRLAIFAPLFLTVFGQINIFHWFVPFTSNLFGIFVLGYIIMWFAVPPASSARQMLEMKGERITARSIRETTQTAAPVEPERTLVAKVVMLLGRILLIILKIFVVLLLIGLVLGTCVLGFVLACSIPMFAFDFVTGLALLCFMLIIIIPLIVLIYLSIMLLITRKPSGGLLLGALILWIILLAGMTVSAIKSPVPFQDQISNTFESAFVNDSDKLFESFDKDEIADFKRKIAESEGMTYTMTVKLHFSVGEEKVAAVYQDDMLILFCGADDAVGHCERTLKFANGGMTFATDGGTQVKMGADGSITSDDGPVVYTHSVSGEGDDASAEYYFTVDDVRVKVQKGNVDIDAVTQESVEKVFGAASAVFSATGAVIDGVGRIVGAAGQMVENAGSAVERVQETSEQIQKAAEELQKSVEELQ